MHFATILFSMIFVLNGLSILNGARLRIDSRSGCSSYTKIHDRKFCDGMRSMGDRDDNGGLFSSAQKCFEYITNPNSKKAKECDGAYFGWNSRDFWTCRCSTSGCSTLVNSGSDTYETDCKKVPTTTTTEAPTTPAAENTGDCKDKNELCQMEPTFLLDILCQIDTVKEQCPKRCSSCPEPVETTEAPTTTTTENIPKWVPIMQIIEDSTFGFSSSYWTNDALLNENSAIDEKVNAKYASFLSKSFNTIRMCSESHDAKCVSYTFGKTWDNAKQLFNSGFQRASDQDQDEILEVYGPTKGYYADCGMQRPGFNIECRDGNKARWGYCVNCQNQGCQTSDNNDADASIGIGLAGQSTSVEMGAGWTEYFASGPGTCSPNSKAFKRVWVSVMNSEGSQDGTGDDSSSGSNWVLGESGSKCNNVCAKVGGTCNSAEQSKLTSKALMEDAMLKATGKPCKVVDFRGYPGAPFYRPGAKDCFYLTNGATSVCDGNDYGGHSPLCYCDYN